MGRPKGVVKENEIVVCGDVAYVVLNRGKMTKIDTADIPMIKGYHWIAVQWSDIWYCVGYNGIRRIRMHRLLLNAPDGMQIDHLDHDGLTNIRSNMRLCTNRENQLNRRRFKNTSNVFKGVYLRPQGYVVTVRHHGKGIHGGTFDDQVEAAKEYDRLAMHLRSKDLRPSNLNFPESYQSLLAQ